MLERENPVLPEPGSKDVIQLWKRSAVRSNVFQNIATQFSTKQAPVLARGGILADDMGLGKTLQIISVILQGGPGTTLIIAPVSVMSNWVQQAQRHVKEENALKVLTYHGTKVKGMTHKDFEQYDVRQLISARLIFRLISPDRGDNIRHAQHRISSSRHSCPCENPPE